MKFRTIHSPAQLVIYTRLLALVKSLVQKLSGLFTNAIRFILNGADVYRYLYSRIPAARALPRASRPVNPNKLTNSKSRNRPTTIRK